MRLRGLEIQGFKSFPDKTKLTFNDGITAVVGPNGSGKSNISDAVRWVLGEQSSKTLRGGKMEDVIFGGTQLRKPQGFAQVQLTIDNQDRALPCDQDQVIISRKLYRSGESEYRLNQTAVRLKDIYELFMDTGLGRDGYSIIGQGRISEIISAKASQRREIFEEAAGIAKYRYRKEEAQRRLEAAEENLLRLRDILAELESRVEPLRQQSEKAAQFLEYASEKRVLEISICVEMLERSKAILREQEDKILLGQQARDDIQKQLDTLEEKIGNLFAQTQRLAVEIDQHRGGIRELQERDAHSKADLAVMENDIQHNSTSIQRLEEELSQSQLSDTQLEERLSTYRREEGEKAQTLEELQQRREQQRQTRQQLRERQDQLKVQVDGIKERRFALTQGINEAKLSSASSTSLIDETIHRLEAIKEGSAIKDENIQRLEKEIQDCDDLLGAIEERLESLRNSRQGIQLKLDSRSGKLEQLERQRRELEDQRRGHLQRAKLLQDLEDAMEGFQHSVKYVMAQAKKGALWDVYGPVSRLISVEEAHTLAIEIALGAAAQNIVVLDEQVAKRAIYMLKESRSGRATFLPLSTVKGSRLQEPWLAEMDGFVGLAADLVGYEPKFAGVIDQLLGRVVVVQDLDCATRMARRGNYRFRVVTLDGQVVNAGGSMTGGYTAKTAGILSRSKEINALKEKGEACGREMEALDGQMKTLKEEVSALRAQALGMDGETATAQEDRIQYTAERKQLGLSHEEALRARQQSSQEYDRLTARLEELRSQNISNSGLVADLESQLSQVAETLVKLSEEREELSQQGQEADQSLSELEVRTAALTNELEGIRQLAAQLENQKADQAARAQGLRQQIHTLREDNQRIAEKIQEGKALLETLSAQREKLNQEIEALSKRRDQCEAESTRLRAQEREITSQRENAARELARLEEQKAGMQGEYDSVVARLWDEYELSRSQAEKEAVPVPDVPKAQRRLTELKGRIKALGNVNVAALEEYREVSKRYQFLKDQVEDVEHSKEELGRLIQSLTRDMKTIFSDNFQKIASNFSQVFSDLFGGGRGELTLEDPSNVLESGIDIFVQPPGKIIKNLSALSGGEQAFVAIAIYFAILKVRPSPFCLLDEIEAALDDVNVAKYAQYLRTLCGETQFIAITHRRGTMEEADVLYGVTMQEEGVSKLLELNVGEVESRLGIKRQ